MLKFLIEKEFKQLVRHSFLPKLIILMPCVMLLLMPWVASYDVKNVNVCLLDNDRSTLSSRMAQKVSATSYFHLTAAASGYSEAMQSIESGKADLILEIQPGFERLLMRENEAEVMISVNAVNGVKGGLGSSYLLNILSEYAAELRSEQFPSMSAAASGSFQVQASYFFNPSLNYKAYMVPALMVLLITLLCGFLPALNIVSEKEAGTIEQLNVTPVGKLTFIVAKLIPYWIVGFIVISMGFALAALLYNLTPAGSFGTIYLFMGVYVLALSGFGLVISSYSSAMQQAMLVAFFFIMILVLMSGLFTPVSSMPQWAQSITIFNPLKYFMQVMRMVYLKGSGVGDMLPQLLALCGFALFSNTWAMLTYKKTK
ncbi:MAG: ABC transporter permease [Prevotellaceae bacterium]|jgi:ABC-2 type transport system permease protein|nr:ABC transporter permease [Prevotellaceae bacterium]